MSDGATSNRSADIKFPSELQTMLDTLYPHDCLDIAENYLPAYEPLVLDDIAVMYLDNRLDKGGKALIIYPGKILLLVIEDRNVRNGKLNVFELRPFDNFGESHAMWLKIFFHHHKESDRFDGEKMLALLKQAAGDRD